MKKFTHKLIAILLCVAMIGGLLPMGAAAVEDETVYTLYPTPHEISYGEGSFELTDINVIYGDGIDEYTEARLEETADLVGLSVTEVEDNANVYVAIYGSGDAAEQYILNNYTVDTTLFTKIDANFVAVDDELHRVDACADLGREVGRYYRVYNTIHRADPAVDLGRGREHNVLRYGLSGRNEAEDAFE